MPDRSDALLKAVLAVGSELELDTVLQRIVEAASTLVGARYAALGVLAPQGGLAQFVTLGLTEEEYRAIGPLPTGHGMVGVLIRDAKPLRLTDLTRHPESVGFPPNHPPMHTFLGVPIRVRGQVFGNLYLTEKLHGTFTEEDERGVVALASAAAVAIENARLFEQTRRQERWMSAIADVRGEVLVDTAPERVLQTVVSTARRAAGASAAMIALLDADGWLRVRAVDGSGAQGLLGLRTSAPDPGGTPSGDERPSELAAALAGLGEGQPVLVPLREGGAVQGLLGVLAPEPDWTGGLQSVLETFAFQAAVAVRLAQARATNERLALMADRDRIARELHDLVIQRLFASGMQLESLSRLVGDERAQARLTQVVDDLDETIREIRSAIYALHTSEETAGRSVRSRILELADNVAPALGCAPVARFTGPLDSVVPEAIADHLVAVASEALSNVARHARASHVTIEIDADEQQVGLEVTDDGVGFAPDGRSSGLTNLSTRAELLGGSMSVSNRPEGGTRLRWQAPLRDRDAHPVGG